MAAPSDANLHLSMEALETSVRAADSCALLVPAWLLQKFAASDRGPGINVFSLSSEQAYAIPRDRLLEIAQREELPLDAPPPGQTVILLARPEADQLLSTAAPEMLLRYWRLLFHARAKQALLASITASPAPRAAVQERIERLGRPAFNEARFVLLRERYLQAGADDLDSYAEFAALYLEFASFCPESLPWFFPSIDHPSAAQKVFAADVDWQSILKSTRPAGAEDSRSSPTGETTTVLSAGKTKRRIGRDAMRRDKLLRKAVAADAVGNDVRAAIFRMRVYRAAGVPGQGRDGATTVYADALKDLDQLAARLKAALQLDDSLARQWRAWLVALLENAAGGWWNAEGRLLYDLQKVCVYHEREIYSVNVMDYLVDLARRPLRRPQPGQRLVLAVKSLRSALRRASRARLSPHGRSELQRLISTALHDAEERLRNFLRPPITAALDEGGLHPVTTVETVARAKLTEELLDEIVHDGYLRFPALRDAVSSNQMKLDDLERAIDFTKGDQLLRIDRKLEYNLDYVYHHGEVYLRSFHRLSSLFFATRVGRFITRSLILPFGGAFLILEGLDHTVGLLIHKLAENQHVVVAAAASAGHAFGPAPATPSAETHSIFNHWWLFLILGFFLLGVINVPPFRRVVSRGFKHFFHALRLLFIDFPRWLFTRPIVRAFFNSHFVRLFGRYIIKPLLFAWFVYTFLPNTATPRTQMFTLAGVFLVVNVILNSRVGRAIEQAILHTLRTTFARFTWELFLLAIRQIVLIFQHILEAIDRLLYAVDELLRFRAGQRRSTLIAKAGIGIVWFFIAYVTRFAVNLLIEPQINPIKHFPVVTVSHKLLFPTYPYLANIFMTLGVEKAAAFADAAGIIWCIPGIFGFLAWEFRENWKLYKANRSPNLKAVRIGSHGETLATFLRPGFHSGTIPKIFHKLRKAQLRQTSPLSPDNKHLQAAHHVEQALIAFFNREFVALLNRHPLFHDTPVVLGHVHLATTVIHVEFQLAANDSASGDRHAPLILTFEQRAGWIIAAVDQPGWSADLPQAQASQLSAALLGLYKLSGVDIIREQVQSLFAPDTHFDFRKNDLIVWPTPDFSIEAAYDLTADDTLIPRFITSPQDTRLPTLRPDHILFRSAQIPRAGWINLWEAQATEPSSSALQGQRISNAQPLAEAQAT